jgi:Ca2+-binding EF-hand superfamily protein
MFKIVDSDGSGKVNYKEFITATMHKSCFTEEIQRATFKMFDTNGDGFIDLEELKSMFNSLMVETLDTSAQFTGEISRRTVTDD